MALLWTAVSTIPAPWRMGTSSTPPVSWISRPSAVPLWSVGPWWQHSPGRDQARPSWWLVRKLNQSCLKVWGYPICMNNQNTHTTFLQIATLTGDINYMVRGKEEKLYLKVKIAVVKYVQGEAAREFNLECIHDSKRMNRRSQTARDSLIRWTRGT